MTEVDPGPPRGGDQEAPPTGSPDGTLGGYLRIHDRPPAFGGQDGYAYTVSIEVEKTGDLPAPYHGYLVFPRWAETGVGIVGHVETPTLASCRTLEEAERRLGDLTLLEVRSLLDEALARHDDTDS
ncbi:MAG: hypothetical protein LJF04_17030 [Gemmatimonadetes bacterium]|nr:hypothetical protein [Gemmatimonadota bacterium]